MSLSIPVWFCVVKSEPVAPNGSYAYRIIQAIKCQWDELDRLYGEYQYNCYSNMGCTTMIFVREPDETPVKAMSLVDSATKNIIEQQGMRIDGLERVLAQEREWRDQIAEDNRILREKLGIQDSHFKYDKVTGNIIIHDLLETQETREQPFEYKDW